LAQVRRWNEIIVLGCLDLAVVSYFASVTQRSVVLRWCCSLLIFRANLILKSRCRFILHIVIVFAVFALLGHIALVSEDGWLSRPILI